MTQISLTPVREELADAVHAAATTEMFLPLAVLFGEDALERLAELRQRARELCRGMVGRVLGSGGAPSAGALREVAAAQMEALRSLARGPAAALLPRSLEKVPREVLGEVGALLREAGMEEWEVDVMLGTHEERGLVVTTHPVTPAQAHVWLLEPLYERVEEWVAGDELLLLERAAANWWFRRWTPARTPHEHEFTQGVREQEFALVDRPFLAVQDVTAVEFLAGEEAEAFPPKQRHMVRQLRESRVGVWEVRERDGEDAVLVSPLDGGRFPVREHAPEHPYGPGWLALGRLIPFGDGTWLRSPGLIFFQSSGPGQLQAMARALTPEAGELPDAAKVEAMITLSTTGTPVPRNVGPAPGVREAAEILRQLPPLMLEAGIAREISPEELPPEVDRARLPEGPLYDYEVDVVMSDWLTALGELARKAAPKRAGKGKKNRKKRGRRR